MGGEVLIHDTNIPSHDTEAEKALLGCLLLDQGITDNVMVVVRGEYFYDDRHKVIFSAMASLHSKHTPIDYISLNNELGDNLPRVGGMSYITSLTANMASAMNYGHYATSVAENYARRRVQRLGIELQQNEDEIDDVIGYANAQLMDIMEVFSGDKKGERLYDVINKSVDDYFSRKQRREEGGVTGIPTPIRGLTKITGGWQTQDLIIVAGRTSMGKTALGLQFAKSAYEAGHKVQFFSFEMSAVRLADRLLVMHSGVSADGFKYGNMLKTDEESIERVLDEVRDYGCYIDDNPNQTVEQIFSKCRIARKKHQCDLVIIDYMQLIKPTTKYKVREQEVSEISRKCKMYAKELDVPVIVIAQVGRSAENNSDKRPALRDLRESGSIEQDADVVLFAYRPEYYRIPTISIRGKQVDSDGVGFVIIGKHRNGETGDIPFTYTPGLTKIDDYKEDHEYTDKPF